MGTEYQVVELRTGQYPEGAQYWSLVHSDWSCVIMMLLFSAGGFVESVIMPFVIN